ncbi:MAG TPA: hypothetical protein VFG14_18020, partial [Chthoniobacteraceae bacterium]|nr:hypothetical protein [Chthoniobacteraceae bacterium]
VVPIAKSKEMENSSVVALKLEFTNGTTDYLLSQVEAGALRDDHLFFDGRTAFARADAGGNLQHLFMQASAKFEFGNVSVECPEPVLQAKVVSVNAGAEGEIVLDRALPAGSGLHGHALILRGNPAAAVRVNHDEYYEIEDVVASEGGKGVLRFRNQSLTLARAHIESIDAGNGMLVTRWPSEVAGLRNVTYLNGRAISVADSGLPTAVVKAFSRKELEATSVAGFKPGQEIRILAVQPGDIATIPATVSLTREGERHYRLCSNTAVTISLPLPSGASLKARSASGKEETFGSPDKGSLQVSFSADWFENGQLELEVVNR